jgi:secreted trypsin-like serine protease
MGSVEKHRRHRRRYRLECTAAAAAVALGTCLPATAVAEPTPTARPFVVGGDTAQIQDYSYAVYLTDGNGNQFCGGVLVGSSAVVTAAHCLAVVPRANIQVVTGREDKGASDGIVARVSGAWTEPGYSTPERGSDVAVLTLDRTVPYRPAKLPSGGDQTLYAAGVRATVLGWGRMAEGGQPSQVLRKATVPIMSDSACSAGYQDYNAKSMVCAGYPQGGVDACQGDSGGPLVVGNTLIGLVSWGEGCARPGKPGIYTRVSTYASDIRQRAGGLLPLS